MSQERAFAPTSTAPSSSEKSPTRRKRRRVARVRGACSRSRGGEDERATFEVTQRQASLERSHARGDGSRRRGSPIPRGEGRGGLEARRRQGERVGLGAPGVGSRGRSGARPRWTRGGRRRRRASGDDDGVLGGPTIPGGGATYACACGRTVAEADRAEHGNWRRARAGAVSRRNRLSGGAGRKTRRREEGVLRSQRFAGETPRGTGSEDAVRRLRRRSRRVIVGRRDGDRFVDNRWEDSAKEYTR